MGALRPEDLVVKQNRQVKNKTKDGQELDEPKKITPKLIMVGGGLVALLFCIMMMIPSGKTSATVGAPKMVEKSVPSVATPQMEKQEQVTKKLLQPAEIARIDANIAKADETLKSIREYAVSIDAEAHNLTLAAERQGQVGDYEGRKESERQVAELVKKRKLLEGDYEKWVSYRRDLAESKGEVAAK